MSEFRRLFKSIHEDQQGAVSLETILIIGAIALPVLIFLIKVGWPKIREYFDKGLDELKQDVDQAKQ